MFRNTARFGRVRGMGAMTVLAIAAGIALVAGADEATTRPNTQPVTPDVRSLPAVLIIRLCRETDSVRYSVDDSPQIDRDALKRLLKAVGKDRKDVQVALRAQGDLPWDDVVDVFNLCVSSGIRKVGFAPSTKPHKRPTTQPTTQPCDPVFPALLTIHVHKGNTPARYSIARGPRMDLKTLKRTLTLAVKARPDQKVLVCADRQALHSHFAAAVVVCKQAGISNTRIGYSFKP